MSLHSLRYASLSNVKSCDKICSQSSNGGITSWLGKGYPALILRLNGMAQRILNVKVIAGLFKNGDPIERKTAESGTSFLNRVKIVLL